MTKEKMIRVELLILTDLQIITAVYVTGTRRMEIWTDSKRHAGEGALCSQDLKHWTGDWHNMAESSWKCETRLNLGFLLLLFICYWVVKTMQNTFYHVTNDILFL